MSPKPSNSPLPNSGVFAGGGSGCVGGMVVANGVSGTLEADVAAGVVGPPGGLIVTGPPGVFTAAGLPGIVVATGPPGIMVVTGPPGVFTDVGVDVAAADSVLRLPAVMLVGVCVGVAIDTRTGVVNFWVGRALLLCVVPADWGVNVARDAGVTLPVGAHGVMAPVGAAGSPGALVGRGAGVRHGATGAFAAGAACLCDVRAGA